VPSGAGSASALRSQELLGLELAVSVAGHRAVENDDPQVPEPDDVVEGPGGWELAEQVLP